MARLLVKNKHPKGMYVRIRLDYVPKQRWLVLRYSISTNNNFLSKRASMKSLYISMLPASFSEGLTINNSYLYELDNQ